MVDTPDQPRPMPSISPYGWSPEKTKLMQAKKLRRANSHRNNRGRLGGGGGGDEIAPTVSSFSPLDNATDVAIDAATTIQFSEDVKFGATVSIEVYDGVTLLHDYDETDTGVGISIAGDTLTVVHDDFTNEEDCQIRITSGSILDLADNPFAGVAADAWSFTTVADEVELLLDSISTAATGAWSNRKLLAAYAGSCKRVRNSVGDAEADIGFGVDDLIDKTALATHVGANDGHTVTCFDQSGFTRNLTQATAASQPRCVIAGTVVEIGTDVADDYDNDFLVGAALSNFIAAGAGYAIAVCVFDALTLNNASPGNNHTVMADAGGYVGMHGKSGDIYQAINYDGTDDIATGTLVATQRHVLEWRHEGGNVYQRVDGANETSAASGDTEALTDVLGVGSRNAAAGFLNGKISTLIMFSTVPPSGERDALVAALT